MKIFVVINNYAEPESTRSASVSSGSNQVCWYEMADSTVSHTGNPFFVPSFDTDFQAHPTLCLRIGKLGKGISARFAHRYFDGWTLALAIVAHDRLKALRRQGLPWTPAVSFDRSCIVGNFQPVETLITCGQFHIGCGDTSITYDTNLIQNASDRILEALSADNTVKTGDLVLVAPTRQGLPLMAGTHLLATGQTDNMKLIDINIK